MRYILLFIIVPFVMNAQKHSDFKKGTNPKIIIVKTAGLSDESRQYYYNNEEKLDSLIFKIDDKIKRKEFYSYKGSSYSREVHQFRDGLPINVTTSLFDEYGFMYKEVYHKNINSDYEIVIVTKNIKNLKNKKQFTVSESRRISNDNTTSKVKEYMYYMDSVLNKVISYNSRYPLDTMEKVPMSIENRNLFHPRVELDARVEFRNDSTFIEYFKNGQSYITERSYSENEYSFCESEYMPIDQKNYKLVVGEIASKDTMITYEVYFDFVDSEFEKSHILYKSNYTDGFEWYKYYFNTKTYSERVLGVYNFYYDEKGNWIKRELRTDDGDVRVVIREISY